MVDCRLGTGRILCFPGFVALSSARSPCGRLQTNGAQTVTTTTLTPQQMEARVSRFNKLQTYQRQNFDAHGIPPGAVEKITARRVYPVMAPADYQGPAPARRSKGRTVSSSASPSASRATGPACTGIST